MLSRRTNAIAKALASGLMMAALAGGSFALTGCDDAKSTVGNLIGGDLGKAITSSRNTSASDRTDSYEVIRDINGKEYVTAAWFEPNQGNDVDFDAIERALSAGGVKWMQVITSDNVGTNLTEHAIVYLPKGATLSDMERMVDAVAKGAGVHGHVMGIGEYEGYLSESPSGEVWDVKIYGSEITHFPNSK